MLIHYKMNDLQNLSREKLYSIAKKDYGYKGSYVGKNKQYFINLIQSGNIPLNQVNRTTLKSKAFERGLPRTGFGNYPNTFI